MPPNKLTSTKRFAVRVSLVTGSTLAVIIGAQSLAALDKKSAGTPETPAPVLVDPALTSQGISPADNRLLAQNNPTTVVHAPPVITILRRPGQGSGTASTQASASSIKPPDPVQLAAPQPVIVQAPGQVIQIAGAAPSSAPAAAPARPTTRASR